MGLGIEGEMLQEKRPLSSSRSTVTGFSLLSGVVVIWASSKSEVRNFCVYLCDSTLHTGRSYHNRVCSIVLLGSMVAVSLYPSMLLPAMQY
ncbi:hypothetical protein SAY86_008280 [Trapa natans]|uniref:Uncharacterized protein n=1 Tax=Trapa natans TaxID=22666 RepID=A0AAN7QAP6_TRANT|nr:hypothetical protein SAY86_008280 [Trapa natans]